jgi:hypothetical protein
MSENTNKYTGFNSVLQGKSILGIHDTSGDMISWPRDVEAINAEMSETALRQIRITASLMTGIPFEALKKKYRSKEKPDLNYGSDDGIKLDSGAASSGLESHPLMPYTGGIIDFEFNPTEDNSNVFYDLLPEQLKERVREKQRKKSEKDRKELSNKLKAKNSFKFNFAPGPAPDRKYRYVAPPPRHVPPKLKPPGA